MPRERLQKILARAGVASRRAAEVLITGGHVRLNSRVVTELGTTADARRDRIELDGQRVVLEKPAYYVLNKPREVVTTLKDPEGRACIGDLVKRIPERVFPVGRLDYHTSGVVLLTNDGAMSQALLHPTRGVPKTYVVKVSGHLDVPELDRLRRGVVLDGGEKTGTAELFVLREERTTTWLQITIKEGKNRQIHRMMEAINRRVMRLSRVSFAGITAEDLRPGEYRPVTNRELMKLERDYLTPAKRKNAAEQLSHRRAQHDLGAEDAEAYAPRMQPAQPGRRARPARGPQPERAPQPARGAKTTRGKHKQRGKSPEPAERSAQSPKRPVPPSRKKPPARKTPARKPPGRSAPARKRQRNSRG